MDYNNDNVYYSSLYSNDHKKEEEYRKTYEKLGYKYDSESKDKKENKEESLDAKWIIKR